MPYPSDERSRVEFWRARIEHAERRMAPAFEASELLIKQYEAVPASERERALEDLSNDNNTARSRANLVFGWIDQSIANLLEREPAFSATPSKPESKDGAPIAATVSNYWYRETRQIEQDQRILLDAFLSPYAVKKIGWTADIDARVDELVNSPEYDFGNDIDAENLFLMTGEAASVSPHQDHELHIEEHVRLIQDPTQILQEDVESGILEHVALHEKMRDRPAPDRSTTVQWEAPFGVRWKPRDFIVDPLAQDGVRDAQWVAFRWQRPLEDVQANPNYRNTQDLEASQKFIDGFQSPVGDEADYELVTGYEIWVRNFPVNGKKRKNLLIVIAEGHELMLRHDQEWPYGTIEDFPCEVLSFQSSVNSWFTKPTLNMAGASTVQGLVNEILDSYISIARKQKNMLLYDSEIIDEDTAEDMRMAPDMASFGVPGLRSHAGRAVQTLDFGHVDGDKGALLNIALQLFDRAAGTPQPQASGADSATEANIFDRRTTAREARRGSLLAQFQINVARKFWQLTTEFRPERLFLIDPRANTFAEITEEVAKGEYRFELRMASRSTNLALERKQWSDLLNLAAGLSGQFMQLYGQAPRLDVLLARLLEKGYEDPRPEDILPMMQNQQQDLFAQADQEAALQDTPLEVPGGGPSLGRPPTEVTSGDQVGPALPRQFNEPAPSRVQTQADAEAP